MKIYYNNLNFQFHIMCPVNVLILLFALHPIAGKAQKLCWHLNCHSEMRNTLNTYAQLVYEQQELVYFLEFYGKHHRNSEQILSIKKIPMINLSLIISTNWWRKKDTWTNSHRSVWPLPKRTLERFSLFKCPDPVSCGSPEVALEGCRLPGVEERGS